MWRIFLKILFFWIFFFVPLVSFTAPASGAKPIRIGATVSKEGKYQETSMMIQSAFSLWEEQVNQRGGLLGRPVKLVLYDDKSKEELVRRYYEKLVTEDKVDLVFSPYGTPLTLVASEVTERGRLVMLACAASGEKIWERGYKYVFGIYALGKRYFIGFLDLMARNGLESVAILHENTPFNIDAANGSEAWARRFGVRVDLKRGFDNGNAELPGLLGEVMKLDPQGLILSAYPPDGYELLGLMKQKGYRPKALGIAIAPVHPDFFRRAGSMAEGVFGPSQWEPDTRIAFPGTRKFIRDFEAFSNKRPSYHAGAAYAACQVLERAINHCQSLDQDKIGHFIRELDTVTIIGRFKVDHKGRQIGHNPLMIQWQHGKKEIVYPTRMQTAAPRF